jgi:hypothetical protein
VTITGRQKDVVIINGANFGCREIESVVEEVAGVGTSNTAACAVMDAMTRTEKLVIFFHPIQDDPRSLDRVLSDVRRSMATTLGIRPDYLVPICASDVPRSTIGKIQKEILIQRFQAGDFARVLTSMGDTIHDEDSYRGVSLTPLERDIAQIWSEVLQIPGIGRHDNFFDLGGDSLAAGRIIQRVLNRCRSDVPAAVLFRSTSVAEMAAAITDHQAAACDVSDLAPTAIALHFLRFMAIRFVVAVYLVVLIACRFRHLILLAGQRTCRIICQTRVADLPSSTTAVFS